VPQWEYGRLDPALGRSPTWTGLTAQAGGTPCLAGVLLRV